MPWHSNFPLGSVSVKANQTIGQDNTTYIEKTMGNTPVGSNDPTTTRDHFWDIGAVEDGRHRFIQSPAFTVGLLPTDPEIGTGMDTVLFAKTTNGRVEWFSRNDEGTYQFVPSVLRGTVTISSNSVYSTIIAVPANCYGEVFLYTTAQGELSAQTGFFRSGAALVEAWSIREVVQSSNNLYAVKLGNGTQASGLNIRARRENASVTSWNYIITYRAL
jgi:hypothetical protein